MTTAKASADTAAKTAAAKTAASSAKPAAAKAPAAKKPAAPKAAAKPAAPAPAPAAEPVKAAAPAPAPEPVAAPVAAAAPKPAAETAPVAAPKVEIPAAAVAAAQKAQTEALKNYESAVAQTKDNLEAVIHASQTLAHGLQDLSKSAFGLAQEAVHDSVAAAKQIAAAKSLREAVDLQTAHAKAQLDRLLNEGAKLSEATTKLVEEAYAPVQARVHAAFEKLTKRP